MPWKKIIAYAAGEVDKTLVAKLAYVLEENRVYRALLQPEQQRLKLTDAFRVALAEKGKSLGKLLGEVITIVQPGTLLKWHRQLVAKKWDYSKKKSVSRGRPATDSQIQSLVIQFAKENPGWGYDRIAGALKNLGHLVCDQTIGNILKKQGLGTAPERARKTTWNQFIRRHKEVLWATDFFSSEVWTRAGLVTFHTLFFIHLSTRKVVIGGTTTNPNQALMCQVARNLTGDGGELASAKYLLHDRDGKYCPAFDALLKTAGIEPLLTPPRSPNLNAYAERWVRSIKDESLNHLILFGEKSLHHVVAEYTAHYNKERNHQGLENVIPFPDKRLKNTGSKILHSERLGGLLSFYCRKAA